MCYLALLIIAIWVNSSDRGMLGMCILLGIGAFIYIPLGVVQDRAIWFSIVFLMDAAIAACALFLATPAWIPIVGLSIMLCIGHLIDWIFQTDPTYYQIANWLEYLEIVSCIIFSPVALNFIRKKIHNAY